MPLWVEAIGMGVVMGIILDMNPKFKERLKRIDNKVFLFDASDIKKRFYFYIKDRDIKVIPNFAGNVDVMMKGKVVTLFGLLLGKEDPDTVFFSRRLEMSGDTAAAIHFKNILNSL
ncbi:MAG: SCP2 sterol-binding domain-containing protein [Deltaproteobacteria bacterium]|nr:SCP2 sterol-binding domain-containing protein [Deltaproteobacteria bacterium]